jgi:hypothetical protein
MRYELIVMDEMAYVAMPEPAAELLFQVISGRAERAAVIVTTNAAVQGDGGSVDGSGAYHRDRNGVVSVPANAGEEQRNQSVSGRAGSKGRNGDGNLGQERRRPPNR